MTAELLLPGLVALALAVVVGGLRVPLSPQLAIRVLTTGAVAVAATATAVLVATAAAFALGPTRSNQLTEWCRIIPLHHKVGTTVGWTAIAGLLLIGIRVSRILVARRRALIVTPDQRILVVDTAEPLAYAVPTGVGCVVVSSGLMERLTPRERQVVFAHERAHLGQKHDRYLLAGSLCQAIVPMLLPLLNQLRHATERCADEAAVAAMGGDRRLVATAVARAAVHTHDFGSTIPAFGGGSVRNRVDALLNESPSPITSALAGGLALSWLAATLTASSIQFHHLAELLSHICRG